MPWKIQVEGQGEDEWNVALQLFFHILKSNIVLIACSVHCSPNTMAFLIKLCAPYCSSGSDELQTQLCFLRFVYKINPVCIDIVESLLCLQWQ